MKDRLEYLMYVAMWLFLLGSAVLAAVSNKRVMIHGPYESQRCDVTEIHVAASRFEESALNRTTTSDDMLRLKLAVSDCVFTSGETWLETKVVGP